jgi:hypothetical protein
MGDGQAAKITGCVLAIFGVASLQQSPSFSPDNAAVNSLSRYLW